MSNKWLLRKASGSRARHQVKGDYKNDAQRLVDLYDDLPEREAMKQSRSYLDTSLVKRWLYSKVGQDFDRVYAEFLTRLQPKYKDEYRDCIYWYVERKELVTIQTNGEVWGKTRSDAVPVKLPNSMQSRFYVNPDSNVLCVIPAEQFKK
jgi:hypothetical protein